VILLSRKITQNKYIELELVQLQSLYELLHCLQTKTSSHHEQFKVYSK